MSEKYLNQALRLGREYAGTFHSCAPTAYCALLDPIEESFSDDVFTSLVGLSGGIGRMGHGTCGLVIGTAAAISFSCGVTRDLLTEDSQRREIVFDKVNSFGDKFVEKYGGLSCREVQLELFGKSFDLRTEEGHRDFSRLAPPDQSPCQEAVEDAMRWGVEVIESI